MQKSRPSHAATLESVVIEKAAIKVVLSGKWLLRNELPPASTVTDQLEANTGIKSIHVDGKGIESWDSGLLVFLSGLIETAQTSKLNIDLSDLPEGVRELLNLAAAVPEIDHTSGHPHHEGMLEHVGKFTLRYTGGFLHSLEFIGDIVMSFSRLVRGKAQFRLVDLFLIIEQTGSGETIDEFESILKTYKLIEVVRTGKVCMVKGKEET